MSAIDSDVTVPVRTRAQGCAGVRDIDKNRPAKRVEKIWNILLYHQMVQGAGSEIRDENLKKHRQSVIHFNSRTNSIHEVWSAVFFLAHLNYCPKGLLCRRASNLSMFVCLCVCVCVCVSVTLSAILETGFGVLHCVYARFFAKMLRKQKMQTRSCR